MDDTDTVGTGPGGQGWDEAYQQDWAPWDIGRPQAVWVRLADAGEIARPSWTAAAGPASTPCCWPRGAWTSWASTCRGRPSIARGRRPTDRGLDADFQVGNVLALHHLGRSFATIIDSGVFHVFSDADRVRYVQSLASVIQQGGVLHLRAFSELTPASEDRVASRMRSCAPPSPTPGRSSGSRPPSWRSAPTGPRMLPAAGWRGSSAPAPLPSRTAPPGPSRRCHPVRVPGSWWRAFWPASST